jgi:myo-inositol-1(or 4)-monophosphatase
MSRTRAGRDPDRPVTGGGEFQEELDIALEAAREAGRLARRSFGTDMEVEFKSPDQPVTRADREVDALLRERLVGARPTYGWLSEETADDHERLGRDRVWIVDPIDGTSSFVEGIPDFVVSVGLADRGVPRVGVVHDPMQDVTYWGVGGGGAFRDGSPIRVSDRDVGSEGGEPRLLISRSMRLDSLRRRFPGWTYHAFGSTANKLVRLAAGEAEGYLTRGERAEWDLCAASVVLGEAGGTLSALDGTPLGFNRPDPRVRGVIAGTPDGYRRLRTQAQGG